MAVAVNSILRVTAPAFLVTAMNVTTFALSNVPETMTTREQTHNVKLTKTNHYVEVQIV
jgi:hypothetical protein